mgnify:CR=1 FL=1
MDLSQVRTTIRNDGCTDTGVDDGWDDACSKCNGATAGTETVNKCMFGASCSAVFHTRCIPKDRQKPRSCAACKKGGTGEACNCPPWHCPLHVS